jgi:hypothetical protein
MRICGAALLSASPLYAAAIDVHAQVNSQNDNSIEREIKAPPGRDVRVGIYTSIRSDCSSGPLPSIRLAVAPEHGSVVVKRATFKATNMKQCLAVEVPAFVAFYRADQNFDGADRFELEIDFSEGRKQLQHFHVSVSKSGANDQGI